MAQHPCSVGANDNRKTFALSRKILYFSGFFETEKNTAEIASLEAGWVQKKTLDKWVLAGLQSTAISYSKALRKQSRQKKSGKESRRW